MTTTKATPSSSPHESRDFRALVKKKICSLLGNPPRPTQIPKQGGHFEADLRTDGQGLDVDNLRKQPCLKWEAFYEAVHAVIKNGGETIRGDAMKPRLGDAELHCTASKAGSRTRSIRGA